MLAHVSDAAPAEIYGRRAVFRYPSLGEGFGLPVLEAMAVGAAGVTSNVSSLLEVGGDAVEYVDPRSVKSIAAGLERVLSSPECREKLAECAQRWASELSLAATAEITLAALERAAHVKPEPPVTSGLR